MFNLNNIDIQSLSFVSPAIVLITGLSFSHLKIFIREKNVLEKDINLILSKIKEKICESYKSLLEASLDSNSFVPLRGDAQNKPDLINNHVNILFKNSERNFKLKKLLDKIKNIYTFLFLSKVISLIVLFVILIAQNIISFNIYIEIGIISVMAILFIGQIYNAFSLRKVEEKVKNEEENLESY